MRRKRKTWQQRLSGELGTTYVRTVIKLLDRELKLIAAGEKESLTPNLVKEIRLLLAGEGKDWNGNPVALRPRERLKLTQVCRSVFGI